MWNGYAFSHKSQMDRVKRIWYLSPMRAAKVQANLRIRAVSPEPPLLAHTSSESRGTFRQKAKFLPPLNGWACAVKICHDGMLEDTNSLDGAQIRLYLKRSTVWHSKGTCIFTQKWSFLRRSQTQCLTNKLSVWPFPSPRIRLELLVGHGSLRGATEN